MSQPKAASEQTISEGEPGSRGTSLQAVSR